LPLLEAVVHLAPDLLLERELGEDFTAPRDQLLEARDHVALFEQLQLLFELQIRGVARHVGELARVLNRPHHLHDRRRATRIEDVLEECAILGRQRSGLARQLVEVGIGRGLDRDPEGAGPLDCRAIQDAAVEPLEGDPASPVWQAAGLLDLRDRADLRVAALRARDEQYEPIDLLRRRDGRAGRVGLDRDRQRHVRQHDAIVEWEERKE